mgnify:CR=1 FL=1
MNFKFDFDEERFKELVQEAVEQALNKVPQEEKTIPEEELLNIEQACALLQCSKTTLYHHRKSGKLPYLQRGRKIFFRKSDLLSEINLSRSFL